MRGSRDAVDVAALMHWATVEVRYSDLDVQGHVNNAVYFTYFEQGRVAYFDAMRRLVPREGGTTSEHAEGGGLTPEDITFVIAEAACVYKRPIGGLRPVAVGVGAARVRHAAIELHYAICDHPGGTVYATGSTLVVSADLATGRPRVLPDWTRTALARLARDNGERGETSGQSA